MILGALEAVDLGANVRVSANLAIARQKIDQMAQAYEIKPVVVDDDMMVQKQICPSGDSWVPGTS